MPFDGGQSTPALNRALLIEALRRQMPDGFTFNYSITLSNEHCGTCGCAMGLAFIMGIVDSAVSTVRMAKALGISPDQSYDIFHNPKTYGFGDHDGWEKVTPQMVADLLERV